MRWALDAGHEIGCHALHHEFLGEANSDTPGLFTLLPEEIDHRLDLATEIVAAVAGVRPVSFRCPRLQSSNQVLAALERLGYTVDGSYPTYFYGKQFAPYYPSREDWREAGRSAACWSCRPSPTSASRPRPAWTASGAGATAGRSCGWKGRSASRSGSMRWAPIFEARGLPHFVCLYLHPWEFVPTPHELVFGEGRFEVAEWLWQNSGEAHLAALDDLIALLRR